MRDVPLPTLPISEMRVPRRSLHRVPSHSTEPAVRDQTRLEVYWASDSAEVLEAQRLRYQVFVEEMGARLTVPPGTPAGYDVDIYDAYCEHLIVRAPAAIGERGPVIGTYRVLTPEAARRVGGLYSETEFDLTRLAPLRNKMVELGRSCVHPDHRHGGAILALWGALAEFMVRRELDTMVGCASISMRDGGHLAATLWHQLQATHLGPIEWQVRPRLALPTEGLMLNHEVEAPPLIKGYLRIGSKLLGPPAWDPDFNTADLPMMLRIEDLPGRYRRHFVGLM